ncbi:plasmid mobilization protein [Haloferula sargassicola]|uniref:plasmid mobilization protein n=1 Tax=Haloferula sargassicola TaxID=490096 RepID=UPI003EBEF401
MDGEFEIGHGGRVGRGSTGFKASFPTSLSGAEVGVTVSPVKTLTFKVSEDEDRMIRLLAEREQLSLSEYLRRRAIGHAGPAESFALETCPNTGARVFSGASGKLTSESVKAMLADFP